MRGRERACTHAQERARETVWLRSESLMRRFLPDTHCDNTKIHVRFGRTRTFLGLRLLKEVWSEAFFLGNTKTANARCLLSVAFFNRVCSVFVARVLPEPCQAGMEHVASYKTQPQTDHVTQ